MYISQCFLHDYCCVLAFELQALVRFAEIWLLLMLIYRERKTVFLCLALLKLKKQRLFLY
jgi:hypothetical protein